MFHAKVYLYSQSQFKGNTRVAIDDTDVSGVCVPVRPESYFSTERIKKDTHLDRLKFFILFILARHGFEGVIFSFFFPFYKEVCMKILNPVRTTECGQ